MKKYRAFAAFLAIVFSSLSPLLAQAQSAMLTVSTEQGQGLNCRPSDVRVWSGRATAIDFSRLKERIVQVLIADPSRYVYTTDSPIKRGEATALFLRRITPLKIPNLTTAEVTNLFVKTKTKNGDTHLYTFNVKDGASEPIYSGLIITHSPTLEVGAYRRATIDDIERGLSVALTRHYTSPNDKIVGLVREFLATARNTDDKSLVDLAKSVNIPLAVLVRLGFLGIEGENGFSS